MENVKALISAKLPIFKDIRNKNYFETSLYNAANRIIDSIDQKNQSLAVSTLRSYLSISKDFPDTLDLDGEEVLKALCNDEVSKDEIDSVMKVLRLRKNAASNLQTEFKRCENGFILPMVSPQPLSREITGPKFLRNRYSSNSL